MFQQPEILATASALARHSSQRQSLVAENIANADTPGYRSRDLDDFAALFESGSGFDMRATRPSHRILAGGTAAPMRVIEAGGSMSPNGNDVSLEHEMLRAASIRQDHDLALAVYRASLGILRTSLGRV